MRHALVLTGALMVLASAGCEDTSTNSISDINAIVFPEKGVSYNRTIQPLLNIGCATSGCHDVKTKSGNLDLSDYLGFRQRFYDVVIKGDTINSRLIWSLEGRLNAVPMPPQKPLNANQIRGFKQWILEGATDTIP
ncbi:MAG: hypothetical protein HUU02_10350 [Bacteroidetes bacterium]|nr:hypothetical protein [Bacteroidota bacterium]